ncbi:MAG: WGR domain-containing protein [Proteobacteria bacterium]|nr:WGR domain-containing protein [Pseudomonadota bacterium]
MARYEFVEGASSKFWEIDVAGKDVTTKWGRIGTPGSFKTKPFPSPEAAMKEHDKLVREKTTKGYALVGKAIPKATKATATKAPATKATKATAVSPAPKKTAKGAPATDAEPRNPTLEQAIVDDPDDDANFSVYGDWLAQQGHPRGELATAQLANQASVAKKLLGNKAVWGELADVKDLVSNVVWKGGFIERARVANTFTRSPDHDGEKPEVSVPDVIGKLLDGPGRFLRELTVGIVTFMDNDYTAIANVLAKRKSIPTLRSLFLGDFNSEETELNWSDIGSIEKLYAAVPNLRKLKLRSGGMKLGKINLPQLRDLTIFTGGLDKASAESIAVAKWPNLEKLDVMFGNENYKGGIKPLQPLLDAKNVPKLTRLGIKNFEFHAELVPALLKSKLLRQLSVLDLSLGTLGDDEAALLAAGKQQLAHLTELIVAANYLTAVGIKQLKSLGITITTRLPQKAGFYDVNSLGQRGGDEGDDEERYPAIYE